MKTTTRRSRRTVVAVTSGFVALGAATAIGTAAPAMAENDLTKIVQHIGATGTETVSQVGALGTETEQQLGHLGTVTIKQLGKVGTSTIKQLGKIGSVFT